MIGPSKYFSTAADVLNNMRDPALFAKAKELLQEEYDGRWGYYFGDTPLAENTHINLDSTHRLTVRDGKIAPETKSGSSWSQDTNAAGASVFLSTFFAEDKSFKLSVVEESEDGMDDKEPGVYRADKTEASAASYKRLFDKENMERLLAMGSAEEVAAAYPAPAPIDTGSASPAMDEQSAPIDLSDYPVPGTLLHDAWVAAGAPKIGTEQYAMFFSMAPGSTHYTEWCAANRPKPSTAEYIDFISAAVGKPMGAKA